LANWVCSCPVDKSSALLLRDGYCRCAVAMPPSPPPPPSLLPHPFDTRAWSMQYSWRVVGPHLCPPEARRARWGTGPVSIDVPSAMFCDVSQNPPIVLLDEATSALDSESEYLVQVRFLVGCLLFGRTLPCRHALRCGCHVIVACRRR
jgi:hypothetical protein